jgi:hypothetical protein
MKVEIPYDNVFFWHFEGFYKCIKRFYFLYLRVGAWLIIYIMYVDCPWLLLIMFSLYALGVKCYYDKVFSIIYL